MILPALLKLGFWGLGAVAVLDSSSIPVPMDAILALYVWNDKGHFWLYCLIAAVGSAIGGLLPYGLGRAGGELFLLKRVNRARFESMRDRFQRQEFLAVMIPSMLPPPAPWKVFVFASGVFEMRVVEFSAGCARGQDGALACAVDSRDSSWDRARWTWLRTMRCRRFWLCLRWQRWQLHGGWCERSAPANCWRISGYGAVKCAGVFMRHRDEFETGFGAGHLRLAALALG